MKRLIIVLSFIFLILIGCNRKIQTIKPDIDKDKEDMVDIEEEKIEDDEIGEEITEDIDVDIEEIIEKHKDKQPSQWGESIEGLISHIETEDKVIALTFDACGGPHGSGYDEDLIAYLIEEQIPATLFINGRWIDSNLDAFNRLSEDSLFEIENHGFSHKPLSVNGNSAYGIQGTENIQELIDEILLNNEKIQELTSRRPKYFRSGTAYYDEVAVEIARDLGIIPVNFDIIGDGGASFSPDQVKNALLSSKEGSIVILHMNQPGKGIGQGLRMAIPILKERGFRFVKLEDYNDYLK